MYNETDYFSNQYNECKYFKLKSDITTYLHRYDVFTSVFHNPLLLVFRHMTLEDNQLLR